MSEEQVFRFDTSDPSVIAQYIPQLLSSANSDYKISDDFMKNIVLKNDNPSLIEKQTTVKMANGKQPCSLPQNVIQNTKIPKKRKTGKKIHWKKKIAANKKQVATRVSITATKEEHLEDAVTPVAVESMEKLSNQPVVDLSLKSPLRRSSRSKQTSESDSSPNGLPDHSVDETPFSVPDNLKSKSNDIKILPDPKKLQPCNSIVTRQGQFKSKTDGQTTGEVADPSETKSPKLGDSEQRSNSIVRNLFNDVVEEEPVRNRCLSRKERGKIKTINNQTEKSMPSLNFDSVSTTNRQKKLPLTRATKVQKNDCDKNIVNQEISVAISPTSKSAVENKSQSASPAKGKSDNSEKERQIKANNVSKPSNKLNENVTKFCNKTKTCESIIPVDIVNHEISAAISPTSRSAVENKSKSASPAKGKSDNSEKERQTKANNVSKPSNKRNENVTKFCNKTKTCESIIPVDSTNKKDKTKRVSFKCKIEDEISKQTVKDFDSCVNVFVGNNEEEKVVSSNGLQTKRLKRIVSDQRKKPKPNDTDHETQPNSVSTKKVAVPNKNQKDGTAALVTESPDSELQLDLFKERSNVDNVKEKLNLHNNQHIATSSRTKVNDAKNNVINSKKAKSNLTVSSTKDTESRTNESLNNSNESTFQKPKVEQNLFATENMSEDSPDSGKRKPSHVLKNKKIHVSKKSPAHETLTRCKEDMLRDIVTKHEHADSNILAAQGASVKCEENQSIAFVKNQKAQDSKKSAVVSNKKLVPRSCASAYHKATDVDETSHKPELPENSERMTSSEKISKANFISTIDPINDVVNSDINHKPKLLKRKYCSKLKSSPKQIKDVSNGNTISEPTSPDHGSSGIQKNSRNPGKQSVQVSTPKMEFELATTSTSSEFTSSTKSENKEFANSNELISKPCQEKVIESEANIEGTVEQFPTVIEDIATAFQKAGLDLEEHIKNIDLDEFLKVWQDAGPHAQLALKLASGVNSCASLCILKRNVNSSL